MGARNLRQGNSGLPHGRWLTCSRQIPAGKGKVSAFRTNHLAVSNAGRPPVTTRNYEGGPIPAALSTPMPSDLRLRRCLQKGPSARMSFGEPAIAAHAHLEGVDAIAGKNAKSMYGNVSFAPGA